MMDRPYFLTDKRWYKRKEGTLGYELTEEAPPQAVESFKQMQSFLERNKSGIEESHYILNNSQN